jgi:hypothetical protein
LYFWWLGCIILGMKTVKLTFTIFLPRVPRFGLMQESNKKTEERILSLHKKFGAERKKLDSKFKRSKITVYEYNLSLFQLSQDQFAYSLFVNWKRFYLTLDGVQASIFLIAPSNFAKSE